LIRYHGKRISEAYGATCQGKFLDEILPPQYRTSALATYHRVLATKTGLYDRRHAQCARAHRALRALAASVQSRRRRDRSNSRLPRNREPGGRFRSSPTFALCTTIEY